MHDAQADSLLRVIGVKGPNLKRLPRELDDRQLAIVVLAAMEAWNGRNLAGLTVTMAGDIEELEADPRWKNLEGTAEALDTVADLARHARGLNPAADDLREWMEGIADDDPEDAVAAYTPEYVLEGAGGQLVVLADPTKNPVAAHALRVAMRVRDVIARVG